MNIEVVRYSTSDESTLGLLLIDGSFECYTLEDEYRAEKVAGETRIPAGIYALELRTFGGFHTRYLNKYGSDFHKGMLEVMNVKGFTDILIHKGNTDDDTAGCLLVGDGANNNQTKDGFVSNSGLAYERLYPKIASELLAGKKVTIAYRDQIEKPSVENSGALRKIDTAQLYLREVPHGLKKGILFEDSQVEIVRAENDWSKVKMEGWVSNNFIR